MKEIYTGIIVSVLLMISQAMLGSAIDVDSLKFEFSNAIVQEQKIGIALSICAIYDTNQKADRDSLIKYALIAQGMAKSRADVLQSKRYYADAHKFLDSLVYFDNVLELQDMYLEDGAYLKAAVLAKEKSIWHAYKLNMEAVRSYARESFQILDRIENPSADVHDLRSLLYYYIANSYNYGESYELALENALEMSAIAEAHDLEKRALMSYEIVGKIYSSLHNNSSVVSEYGAGAESYFIKAYKKAQTSDFEDLKYGSAFNLGQYYYDNDQADKAQALLEYSLTKARTEKSIPFEFNSLIHLGSVYMKQDKVSQAKRLCDQADELAKYAKSPVYLRSVNSLYAEIYVAQKQWDEARRYGELALDQTLSQGNVEPQLIAYRRLEEIETAAGNWRVAMTYDKQADTLQDSLLTEKSLNNIQRIKDQNEIKTKEQEISYLTQQQENLRLRSQNKVILLLGLLSLVMAGFVWYYFYNRNQQLRQENSLVALEQKLLRSQMNPHFIFNAISSIQNYLFNKSDLSTALHYMSKFGDLMRQILENSREESVTLQEEITALTNYLELQQLRYSNSFGYEIKVDDEINSDTMLVPPLIAQPFVENAIEHGMIYRIENGKVIIHFKNEKDKLGLYIRDNGVAGRKMEFQNKNIEQTKKSLSTIITKERLNHISLKNRGKFELITEILANGGTLVSISLPKLSVI